MRAAPVARTRSSRTACACRLFSDLPAQLASAALWSPRPKEKLSWDPGGKGLALIMYGRKMGRIPLVAVGLVLLANGTQRSPDRLRRWGALPRRSQRRTDQDSASEVAS